MHGGGLLKLICPGRLCDVSTTDQSFNFRVRSFTEQVITCLFELCSGCTHGACCSANTQESFEVLPVQHPTRKALRPGHNVSFQLAELESAADYEIRVGLAAAGLPFNGATFHTLIFAGVVFRCDPGQV